MNHWMSVWDIMYSRDDLWISIRWNAWTTRYDWICQLNEPMSVHWMSLGYHVFKRWPMDIYTMKCSTWTTHVTMFQHSTRPRKNLGCRWFLRVSEFFWILTIRKVPHVNIDLFFLFCRLVWTQHSIRLRLYFYFFLKKNSWNIGNRWHSARNSSSTCCGYFF